jgi:hypothetical protein
MWMGETKPIVMHHGFTLDQSTSAHICGQRAAQDNAGRLVAATSGQQAQDNIKMEAACPMIAPAV